MIGVCRPRSAGRTRGDEEITLFKARPPGASSSKKRMPSGEARNRVDLANSLSCYHR
jgi:hypothetical protein